MTRTENSKKNMITGMINQLLILIFRFITRTVFIYCLGEQYLGINGLFTNILTLLSLTDLGIGTALVFSLYKPIAQNDIKRQNIIIHYLKRVYIIIGLIIIAISLVLMPFLPYIIKEKVDFINLNIVFLIYVFQTASTYLFFASNTEFLNANQKNYIVNKISNIITIISNFAQILVLIIFKDFYIYIITVVIFGIIQSGIIAYKARKMYPFLKQKPKETLTKQEKKEIFKDCGSLLIYRTNYVVLTASDNVVISKFLGLSVVGLYSNYLLIVNSIINVLSTFFNAITASIGNLHASEESDKEYFIFRLVNLLTVTFFGVFAIGVYCLANEFITIWIGEKYLITGLFVLILAINLYIEGLRKFLSSYRSSHGLFRNAKFMPLFGMIVNIVVSILLVQKIGIFGVLLGTLISNLVSFMWYDPFIIYKKSFLKSPKEYYIKNIIYLLYFIVMGCLCNLICSIIPIHGVIGFIIRGFICVILPLVLLIIYYYNSEYGQYLKYALKNRRKGA